MVSFAAQRMGHSLLSFELASRSRSLAFTVVSVERQRQHPTQPQRQFHSVPQRQSHQQIHEPQAQQHRRPNLVRPFSTHPQYLQQTTTSQPTTPSSAAPPFPTRSPTQSSAQTTPQSSSQASQSSPSVASTSATTDPDPQSLPITDISANGLADAPPPPAYTPTPDANSSTVDWAHSFHGLSTQPFPAEVSDILLASVEPKDIEIKPDGIIYLPEIKYRRILNRAFGPGGWGLAPRSETIVTPKTVTREYALLAHGRLMSVARGEQEYFDREGIPTATEGCKSNALMRCCKDLGVASELWDPRFIRVFMKENGREVWVEHVVNKRKRKIWVRKGDEVGYPYKETKYGS